MKKRSQEEADRIWARVFTLFVVCLTALLTFGFAVHDREDGIPYGLLSGAVLLALTGLPWTFPVLGWPAESDAQFAAYSVLTVCGAFLNTWLLHRKWGRRSPGT